MADDKTIHIKVEDDGSFSPQNPPNDTVDDSLKNVQKLDDALHSFTVNTITGIDQLFETHDPKKKPGRPKKSKGGGGDDDDDDSDDKKLNSKFLSFLKNAQKVSTALTGVNSKSTKTLAVLIRTTKLYQQSQANGIQLQQQANTTQATLNAAQAAATVTTTKLGGSAGGAGGALGGFGGALISSEKLLGVFAIVVGAAAIAAKLLDKAIVGLEDNVKSFSAALNIAKAQTNVKLIQQQFKSARQVGGDLATLERERGAIAVQLQKLETNLISVFAPALKVITGLVAAILTAINAMLAVINLINSSFDLGINALLAVGEHIPYLGRIFTLIRQWIHQNEVNNIDQATKINRQVETIFDPGDVNLPGNAVDARFL